MTFVLSFQTSSHPRLALPGSDQQCYLALPGRHQVFMPAMTPPKGAPLGMRNVEMEDSKRFANGCRVARPDPKTSAPRSAPWIAARAPKAPVEITTDLLKNQHPTDLLSPPATFKSAFQPPEETFQQVLVYYIYIAC